ncbi:MAG: hypothetical protein KDE00_08305, partial [Rhodobacteraceae bacterium]|nr:hypothetical protein [Paracoccaceae bacterium]
RKTLTTDTQPRRGPRGAGDGVVLAFPGEPALEDVRDDYLRLLLRRHAGNRSKVAAIHGVSERDTCRLGGEIEQGEKD